MDLTANLARILTNRPTPFQDFPRTPQTNERIGSLAASDALHEPAMREPPYAYFVPSGPMT